MTTRREREKKSQKYADARRRDTKHGGDWTPTSYKVPDKMERFRWKEPKKYRIDVVPYLVGKGKHPENSGGPNPYADEGELYYERTFWIHQGIGPNQRAQYCCPAKNWGKRCPICEYCDKNRDQKGLFKAMGFKTRQLWLFVDRDAKEKGIQIFESAYKMGFGEQIHEFRLGAENDDPRLDFWHLEDGMTLEVKIKEDSWEGRKTMKPSRIDFVPRKNPMTVEDGKVPCLDDLLIEKSYKELEELLNATGSAKEDDDSKDDSSDDSDAGSAESQDSDADSESDSGDDSQASGAACADETWKAGATVKHKKLGICEVVHVSGDGTSLKLKDKKGKVHNAIDPDDCEAEEEPNALNHFQDEKEEKAKGKKKPVAKDSESGDDSGDDDSGGSVNSDAGSDDASGDTDDSQDSDASGEGSADSGEGSTEDSADASGDGESGDDSGETSSWDDDGSGEKPAAKPKKAPVKPKTPAKKPPAKKTAKK